MQVTIVVLAVALVILFFPIAVFVCKRIAFCIKLKSVCNQNAYMLIPTHFFWFLGNFNGGKCDCYIQTPERMYSVKLCGASSKTFIDFVDDARYGRRSIRFHISPELPVMQEKSKKKFDFRYKCPEMHAAQMTPVILMYPMPLKVSYRRKWIGNGDYVVEGYFYDREGFMKILGDETAVRREGRARSSV